MTPGQITGALDIVVEILSPSSRTDDHEIKFALYERAGIPEYWIVDPVGEAIGVHTLTDGQYTAVPLNDQGEVVSRVLPGFTLDPAVCFVDELGEPLGE